MTVTMENLGKLIVGIGAILVVVGLVIWLFADKLGWLGNLPGDIKIERPGFRLYFPITTMLLISLLLSLVMWLIGKLTR
jgi:H+/Cl- antiporter ClcA